MSPIKDVKKQDDKSCPPLSSSKTWGGDVVLSVPWLVTSQMNDPKKPAVSDVVAITSCLAAQSSKNPNCANCPGNHAASKTGCKICNEEAFVNQLLSEGPTKTPHNSQAKISHAVVKKGQTIKDQSQPVQPRMQINPNRNLHRNEAQTPQSASQTQRQEWQRTDRTPSNWTTTVSAIEYIKFDWPNPFQRTT